MPELAFPRPVATQHRPHTTWLRLSTAAARIGVAPDILAASIKAGRARIRLVEMGQSGIRHVAVEDFEQYAADIAAQGVVR